ncbi:hypothetical protein FVEG_09129 [Fusarium verticillioides 7600]|uniref:Uncharacterized protein n=1 Tax=Gibberella moniliformis (strain M3125 / FGSC 7600) TaxID=334819 RepID=W7MPG1_GIBM7|nr:hypothetical protein FVEG_09129 [Fusarium verticillioides 7600]EWG49659.1 hypothetical protein FVEG_09129 [Fusarium verticillioides 7600]RBR18943.1 hypothetical protein FVER53590_09129 [Fusarium verticillioides]
MPVYILIPEPLHASSSEHTCTRKNIDFLQGLSLYDGKLGWHFLVSQSKTESRHAANKYPRKLKVVY